MTANQLALSKVDGPNILDSVSLPGTEPSAGTVIKPLCLADLKKRRVSHHTKHPAPAPVIRIDGAFYGLQGMISALTGPPKSGKTTVIGYMMASTLSHVSDAAQTLNIQSTHAGSRDVVYFDFEQHVSSTQDLHDKVLRYAGLASCPENLHVMNLLEYTMEERKEAIDLVFRELDVHLLIIDGLADLLPGVNDEEKSNMLIEKLALSASQHNTCVIVVIHENKGGGTVRGHLGSQIERKCAGLIAVRKDRESKVHSIESRLIRIGDDFDNVLFRYSDEHRGMVLLDAVSSENHMNRIKSQKLGKDKDPEFLGGLMKLCFSQDKTMSKAQLQTAVVKIDSSAGSVKTANRRIEGAIDLNILDCENDVYTLR